MKTMEKNKLQTMALAFLAIMLIATFAFADRTSAQQAFQTVRIRADGTIDPASTPIQKVGDKYVFTGDIYAAIVVERANIIIDGAGYSLYGPYNGTKVDDWMIGQGPYNGPSNASLWTIGIDFDAVTKPNNVTVRNLNIRNFYFGIYVGTFNDTVEDNSITANIVGILLSGDSNTITRNYIAKNDEGVFYGVNNPNRAPINTVLTGNSFTNNTVQFSGCGCGVYNETEPIHTWDNGERGNFWSDYNGTDTNGNGLGDTSYIIDIKNQDRYPLMQNTLSLPTPAPKLPVEAISVASLFVVAAVLAFFFQKKKNKP